MIDKMGYVKKGHVDPSPVRDFYKNHTTSFEIHRRTLEKTKKFIDIFEKLFYDP